MLKRLQANDFIGVTVTLNANIQLNIQSTKPNQPFT